MTDRIEYGLKLDCEKEGCSPYHKDHGHVYGSSDPTETTINNHAATLCWRTVTTSDWKPVNAANR